MAGFHGRLFEFNAGVTFGVDNWLGIAENVTRIETTSCESSTKMDQLEEKSKSMEWSLCTDFSDLSENVWAKIFLKYDQPLIPILNVQENDHISYFYQILIRLFGANQKALILCPSHELASVFLNKLGMARSVSTPIVDTKEIVNTLSKNRDDYRMGVVTAHVDGHGKSLTMMKFWGNDVAETAIFREFLSHLNSLRVRLKDPITDRDVVEVSSGAHFTIPGISIDQLKQVDSAFKYFEERSFISWRFDSIGDD